MLRVSLRFRDYWLGNGKRNVDWLAVWRNWVRNEKGGPIAGARASLTQAGQRTAEAAERWLGKTGTDDREGER